MKNKKQKNVKIIQEKFQQVSVLVIAPVCVPVSPIGAALSQHLNQKRKSFISMHNKKIKNKTGLYKSA